MGKYTILDEPDADQAVQDVLDLVVKEILSLMGKHLQAIVLMGGYGRGEGGVYKKNGRYRLINDLDLAVFVRGNVKKIKKVYNIKLKETAKILQPQCNGIKQIDIDITSPWRHRLAPNLVNYYEIKNGHQVVYGNINLDSIMPHLTETKLPVFDGTIYFYSRGSGLLLPLLYEMTDSLDNEKYRENFQIEIQKACQAMGDSLLLMHRKYHFSYKERLRRFEILAERKNIIPEHLIEKLLPLYRWGVANKLQPELVQWTKIEEMRARLKEVCQLFSAFFLWFESKRLNKAVFDWYEYSEYLEHFSIQEPPFVKIREIAKSIIEERRLVFRTKRNKLLAVMPLLLFVKDDPKERNRYLSRAKNVLNKWGFNASQKDWLSLTKAYLKAYHPHGAVGEALTLCEKGGVL
jgi:hypothetical protein